MAAITIRVSDETGERLDQLAERLDLSVAAVASQAVEDFISRQHWQISEIEAGLTEAARGDFASEQDIATVIARYINPAS